LVLDAPEAPVAEAANERLRIDEAKINFCEAADEIFEPWVLLTAESVDDLADVVFREAIPRRQTMFVATARCNIFLFSTSKFFVVEFEVFFFLGFDPSAFDFAI
jgi:hypothetical protein